MRQDALLGKRLAVSTPMRLDASARPSRVARSAALFAVDQLSPKESMAYSTPALIYIARHVPDAVSNSLQQRDTFVDGLFG